MMSTTPFTLQYQPKSITSSRVVTKISSYRVHTTSRQGIKRLGISFGSTFLLFSNKSSRGPLCQQPGKIPGPRLLMTTLLKRLLESKIIHASGSYMNLCHLHVTYQCTSKHSGEGRGGEGRGDAGEKEVHIHGRQVCFAEIILGLTVLTLGTWSTPGPSCSKGQ